MADVWNPFLTTVRWRTCCLSSSTKDDSQELNNASQCKAPFYDESVPHDVDKSLISASLAAKDDETTPRERPEVEVVLGTYKGQWLDGKRHGYGWLFLHGELMDDPCFYGFDGATYEGFFHLGRMHGWGVLTHANGNRYEGQWQHDQQHGRGKYTRADSRRAYEGEWRFSARSGRGIETMDGLIYEGQFENDERDGEGIFRYTDGGRYYGQWKGGLKHGAGTWYYPNGSKYEGEFAGGMEQGDGTLTSENYSYQGRWKNGKRDGGVLFTDHEHVPTQEEWRDGLLLRWRQLRVPADEEELAPGQKVVQCNVVKTSDTKLGMSVERYGDARRVKITELKPGLVEDWSDAHPDQRIEIGDAIMEINGSSGFSLPDLMQSSSNLAITILKTYVNRDNGDDVVVGGDEVDGRDSPDMRTSETYEDGSSYQGQMSYGKRNGQGTVQYKGQYTYNGQWQDDMMHGHGCQSWSDGRSYDGQYFKGKFMGAGKMEWNTLKGLLMYEGEYENDLKQGVGKFTWADGRHYEGQWFVGKRHGAGIYTNIHGAQKKGHWVRDKFEIWAKLGESESLDLDEVPKLIRFTDDAGIALYENQATND